MPLVVKAEGFAADVVRLIFYGIVALYLVSMLLPTYVLESGETIRGWRAVRTTLVVPVLFPSNFGFFVSASLIAGARYLGGLIVAMIATVSMFGTIFIRPGGGTGAWSGHFGAGFYCWIAAGVLLSGFALLLYLTQSVGVTEES